MKKNNAVQRPTAVRLVELAKERHEEVVKKASVQEKANQKQIDELTAKEKELKVDIEAGRKQLEKMIDEFNQLEKETAIRNLEEVKENASTVEDVKSGKITMTEFSAKGMQDSDIEKTVILKTQADLESASDAIRSKAVDIVRLELELFKVQNTIHNLTLNPVRSLLTSYTGLLDMLQFQLGPLASESHQSQSEKVQKEHEIMLIEHGVSVGGGYTWSNITLEQAYLLKFDPIVPKEEIPSLLEKLAEFKADDNVRLTVSFRTKGSFFPGDPVEVREE